MESARSKQIGAAEAEIRRADGRLGIEVHGLDVRGIDPGSAAEILEWVHREKLVVLRRQKLDDEEYIAFARALGEPQIYFQENYHHPEHPEIFVSANVPLDGRKVGVAGTGAYWHSDYQFFPQPLPLTMVTPRAIPSGNRATSYIDMEAVYRTLPAHLARLVDGKRAIHEAKWRYKIQACDIDKSVTQILEEFGELTPTVTHPAVMTHPVTGQKCLYISRGFTVGIEGMSVEEGRAALDELLAFIERPEHVHSFAWTEGDILLWDNRQVIHMAEGGDPGEASVSYRIGVYDGLQFCADEPEGKLLQ